MRRNIKAIKGTRNGRGILAAKPVIPLLLLFLLAFVVRAAFPDTSYFFWDETVYLLHGQLFSGHGAGYSELFQRPPLLPLLLSPFAGSADYELFSRLLVAFLNSLAVFPVYFLTTSVFGRGAPFVRVDKGCEAALIAAALIAFLPVHIINSRWVMTDALGALLAFSAVTAYLIGFQKRSSLLLFGGGVLAALSILMKFTNLLVLVLLLPLILINLRERWKGVLISGLLFAATLLPYLIFNLLSFGNPFFVFQHAFHVVAESDPAGMLFFIHSLMDVFGFLLVFMVIGVVGVLAASLRSDSTIPRRAECAIGRNPICTIRQPQLYILYCLLIVSAYSFFILNRGVAKPPGLEWEAERFLLLLALFAVPFVAAGITSASAFLASFFRRYSAVAVLLASAFVILSIYPQFLRAYTPATTYEDGLRVVTRELGVFIRTSSVSEFGCSGNCPPVAYYSGKKMSVYYKLAELSAANHEYVVVFDDSITKISGRYRLLQSFCDKRHCSYLVTTL